jgi:hypothetical protein
MTAGSTAAEVTTRVLVALRALDGVRPWSPIGRPGPTAVLPWDPGVLAVDLADTTVRVRLVAECLPLPPVLDRAEVAVRQALTGSRWADARLRLVVSALDIGVLPESP